MNGFAADRFRPLFHIFTFPQFGIQLFFPDSQRFRSNLQKLVSVDEIQRLFQRKNFRRRQAQRIIRSMADSGLVRRVGAGRTTRYVLPDNNGDERQ